MGTRMILSLSLYDLGRINGEVVLFPGEVMISIPDITVRVAGDGGRPDGPLVCSAKEMSK